MTTMLVIPPSGGVETVATSTDLPSSANTGTVYLVQDTGILYWWNGTAWAMVTGMLGAASISDTTSVDLTVTAGVISAAVKISTTAATAGYLKGTTTIKTGAGAAQGIHVEIPIAATGVTGALSGTDWDTFNGKVTGNVAIVGATKCKVTYDSKGLVTAGADLGASDIPSLDAAKITTGTFDIARIPAAALERVTVVADQAARYALTTATVQLGDVVYQTDTAIHYFVIDTDHLGDAGGYQQMAAGTAAAVAWSGITTKPDWTAQAADATHDGYLADHDWSTFNGKMAGNATIRALTAIVDGSAATAGQIGEKVTANVAAPSGTNVGATTEWGDVTSIALSAGIWAIFGVAGYAENGATLTGSFKCGIHTTSGNNAPSLGRYAQYAYMFAGGSDNPLVPIPYVVLNVAGATTVYLKTFMTYADATPQHWGYIEATRIG